MFKYAVSKQIHVRLKVRGLEGFMCVPHKHSKYVVKGTQSALVCKQTMICK